MSPKAEKVSNFAVKKRFGTANMFFILKKWSFNRLSRSSKANGKGKSFIHHRQNMITTLLEEK